MINPRKEGKFVTEKRCACLTSQLYAIKFNKVQCKLMSQYNKNSLIFCFAFFFFFIFFAPLAVLFSIFPNSGLTILHIVCALFSGALAIIMTIICASLIESTHTALEVLYKCRTCGHEVHVTYEVLPDVRSRSGGEIFNAYGRYTRMCHEPKPLSLKTTAFDDLELDETNDQTPALSRSNAMHSKGAMLMPLLNRALTGCALY
uniref:LITAF domain-containing protein n=1 Tax=Globodera rostochiensis TaxID=31243 RepID=A0A914GQ86_GLORO